jgi:ribonuclease HI
MPTVLLFTSTASPYLLYALHHADIYFPPHHYLHPTHALFTPSLFSHYIIIEVWVVTQDEKGEGLAVAQGARNLGGQQTAFDAEVAAIEQAIMWFYGAEQCHMVVHSDSTSAITRASHTGAGPGQSMARHIPNMVHELRSRGEAVDLVWVKGHQGTPSNERADTLAGQAAGKAGTQGPCPSLT